MSPTHRPSLSSRSAQDSKLSHLSLAPPALETPSRFAALARANASPRSRRARATRGPQRVVRVVVGLLAFAAAVTAVLGRGALSALVMQVWNAV